MPSEIRPGTWKQHARLARSQLESPQASTQRATSGGPGRTSSWRHSRIRCLECRRAQPSDRCSCTTADVPSGGSSFESPAWTRTGWGEYVRVGLRIRDRSSDTTRLCRDLHSVELSRGRTLEAGVEVRRRDLPRGGHRHPRSAEPARSGDQPPTSGDENRCGPSLLAFMPWTRRFSTSPSNLAGRRTASGLAVPREGAPRRGLLLLEPVSESSVPGCASVTKPGP